MARTGFDNMQRLKDLYKKWGFRARALRRARDHAGALQTRSDLPPSLLRRLTRWVEQIAGLEEAERSIVSEITEIEERHRALRKTKKLRKAAPLALLVSEQAPERGHKGSRLWFWLLLLWIMKSSDKKRPEPRP